MMRIGPCRSLLHKDGCVTQGSIVENELLSGALTEIRKRQQSKEKALVKGVSLGARP